MPSRTSRRTKYPYSIKSSKDQLPSSSGSYNNDNKAFISLPLHSGSTTQKRPKKKEKEKEKLSEGAVPVINMVKQRFDKPTSKYSFLNRIQ